jgi:hypothetical protein
MTDTRTFKDSDGNAVEVDRRRMVDITPTPEFQLAFTEVTGLECTPGNVITVIRQHDDLMRQVEIRHAEIVDAKHKAPSAPTTDAA